MTAESSNPTSELPAGDFSEWLSAMQTALRGEANSDVACGGCTACCTSSQFIHIGPDEPDTLAHIPSRLVFAAPGLPWGHVVMGYDEQGCCPMFSNGGCSIYAHRPRSCRTYDCRIFPATGIDVGEDHIGIARQARRWEFTVGSPSDRTRHDAVRAAAAFLHEHRDRLPVGLIPTNPTQLAVLAIEIHTAFLGTDAMTGAPEMVAPSVSAVESAIRELRSTPESNHRGMSSAAES